MNRRVVNICECGDHAWAALTKGHTTLVDAGHRHLLDGHSWCASGVPGRIYAQAWIGGKTVYLHHMVVGTPIEPSVSVDHKLGDTTDNRSASLRVVPQSVNARNRKAPSRGAAHIGVSRSGKRWKAEISDQGRRFYLGSFSTPEAAAAAYRQKLEELMSPGC